MSPDRGRRGFTILEILIVVLLIAVLAGFFLGFPSATPGGLRNSGRVVAGELQYTAQRAVATGRLHRWVIDLDQQIFRIEERVETDAPEAEGLPSQANLLDLAPPSPRREYLPVENRSGEWRWLDDPDVVIDELRVGDDTFDDRLAAVGFAPDGGADPAEVWLRDEDGYRMRARVVAFTGEIHLEDEFRESP